jgi:hypothetical protein
MTATPRRSFARKLAAAVLVTTAGFGLATVAATPAMAAPNCTLDFFHDVFDPPNTYRIALPCSSDVIFTGAVALYAEDFPSDNRRGGHYQVGGLVDRGVLNEDDSIFNREDEIYARVIVFLQNGGSADIRTNTVHRSF